jgi:hypothetical protein
MARTFLRKGLIKIYGIFIMGILMFQHIYRIMAHNGMSASLLLLFQYCTNWRGPLSLVSTTEELLQRKSSGSGLESREHGRRDPSHWPRGTLYPQKLALTSPTSGGRSVGIVLSRTQATELSFLFYELESAVQCHYVKFFHSLFISPSHLVLLVGNRIRCFRVKKTSPGKK